MKKIETVRHSLAHIMALAVKNLYGDKVKFGVGPVIENGFYYDFDFGKTKIGTDDIIKIENEMRRLIKQNLVFKKEVIPLDEAVKLFKNLKQDYKLSLLKDLKKYGTTGIERKKTKKIEEVSIYKTGDFTPTPKPLVWEFTDLCAGPHVKTTKEIDPESFKLISIAGAYWRGDEHNPMLTRIYGLGFLSRKDLKEHLELQEEIEKRDHRKMGERLGLFSFQEVSPGAPFWHPKGMIIVKELEKLWRKIHDENGYQEISTPTMVKSSLFKQSGHLEYYRENMFKILADKEEYYLKPMNCPESTFIYKSKIRSYKDLPIRLSEIGRLYRNELSGTLGGLFRVRQLTMDDAHIYCRPDQILNEINGVLKLILDFYKIFNFEPDFKLATKPANAMGDAKLWKKAENDLQRALEEQKVRYSLKPKDGAFYGPKIDIHIKDALSREWQLATIQLDFQMPERFKLEYVDEKGKKQRPVMIHRAIFGSFERFIGILIEHHNGALPFWLSPTQIIIIPISERHLEYARKITGELKKQNFRVEINSGNETLGKRVREAEIQKIPYIIVIGDREIQEDIINIRSRDDKTQKIQKLEDFINNIKVVGLP